ncbi:osmoprotectant update ABC transporter ATP-binding subunit OpuFA [Terribacillus saccharophilus]|uniref:osmoprotectant update ABC transporter ATP-binding subunit OpuFA n=1 Tax=Terribacillus saccharophilus TaxID=361277 RepID=UPI0039824E94
MIKFEQVAKIFPNGTFAVQSLNLEIKKGEFLVLIGPSGSGKTTTLKMINRLISLTEGTVLINDKKINEYDINELRWNIGYVLQQIALFPHMTIAENIAIVPELRSWKKDKIDKRIDELLQMVGLDPEVYKNRKPNELSGGQQQRVGVLRALAADPEILLMDEPFSALDPFSRESLQDDLLELQQKIKKTIVFVTHDMQEALKLGDRICVMNEGEIVQIGTPEELLYSPANEFVQDFFGKTHHAEKRLKDLDIPLIKIETSNPEKNPLSLSTPLYEVLEQLSSEDSLPVEENGKILGLLSRQDVLQYIAQSLKDGGKLLG